MDGLEEIRVLPPRPGVCRECAAKHDPTEPHDRNSLYYENRFRRRYKRFPTWADAMAHCSAATQASWRAKLRKMGVAPEELGGDGR